MAADLRGEVVAHGRHTGRAILMSWCTSSPPRGGGGGSDRPVGVTRGMAGVADRTGASSVQCPARWVLADAATERLRAAVVVDDHVDLLVGGAGGGPARSAGRDVGVLVLVADAAPGPP